MGNWKYIIILAIVVTVIVTNIAGLWDSKMIFDANSAGDELADDGVVRLSNSLEQQEDPRAALSEEQARVYTRAIALNDQSLCETFESPIKESCKRDAQPAAVIDFSEEEIQDNSDARLRSRAIALQDPTLCSQIIDGAIRADCEVRVE